jgi:hypothetical protein
MTTTTSNTPNAKYGAKEYHGDRPCIDPLTMAELRLRLYGGPTARQSWLYDLGRLLWRALKQ